MKDECVGKKLYMRNEIVVCQREVFQNVNINNEEMYKIYALK